MICALFLYAVVMALWAIIVAASRSSRSAALTITLALLVPIVVAAMVCIMGLSVAAADEVHGLVLYTPTIPIILYFLLSIWLVIWAHTARIERIQNEPRGFPIEPTKSAAPKDSDSV